MFPCLDVKPLFIDAVLFYYLETWTSSRNDAFTTHYLTHIEAYQRFMSTAAYKIAGGIESPSSLSKAPRQNAIPQIFVTKITKAFMDALYAFLDGMILLASNESPIAKGQVSTLIVAEDSSPLESLDLKDGVRNYNLYPFLEKVHHAGTFTRTRACCS